MKPSSIDGSVSDDLFLRATTEGELRLLANLVVQAALRRGSKDNTTCVLLKIKWGEHHDEMHGGGELQTP
jgi:serine/threonine protein phosphatase PrpC